jgi:hypothetical protein
MNTLQRSIAAIGLGAALAFSAPATLLASGPQHARPAAYHVQHVGHGDYRPYRGPRARHPNRHWRQHHRHWRQQHRHWRHRHGRPHYAPAVSDTSSDPSIVISPTIQFGGGGGVYSDGGSAAPSSTLGTVVGAVAGAAVGSQIGKGRGNTAAIAIGSVVGGHLGGRIGAQ